MKKLSACLLILAMIAPLLPALSPLAEAEALPEWTVMYYLCGSDLESKHGYATENLKEISACAPYAVIRNISLRGVLETPDTTPQNVNVVIETGGCEEWHAGKLGMDIDPKALQRWRFHPPEGYSREKETRFELVDERSLASMAAPETLADFVRWGAENYPAKKYALILWDHGGGSKTGLFIDELFDGDILYLDELRTAMTDGGVNFEAVVFDACLMAGIETACAIKDSAKWMIASEEVVAGKGTAVGAWLQQLYLTPQADGERLGRWICDMTLEKYANEEDEQAQSTLTWSVIDLSQIEHLAELVDLYFEAAGRAFADDPLQMPYYADALSYAFQFGLNDESMIDLSKMFSDPFLVVKLDRELYFDMLDTLTRTVVYNVHGPGRAGAGGLSMCYAASFSLRALEIYARNCPLAHYLAFLDAINPMWTAPDWVYGRARRLPDVESIEDYQICVEKVVGGDDTPGVTFTQGFSNIMNVCADIYMLDEETGFPIRLGYIVADVEITGDLQLTYSVGGFGMWPAIEGVLCDAECVIEEYRGQALYSIPVQIGADYYQLRCAHSNISEELFTIYGLWEGYDADSTVFNRNITSLSKLEGREFCLIYPIDGASDTGRTLYESSAPLTMYRSLDMKMQPLPAGTYYLDFWVEDMFARRLPIDRAEVRWDGENVSLASGDSWQGKMTLTTPQA